MIWVRWIAISFVMRQRCFPHIGMFSFLHRECINLHEGRLLRNKMHLHSTLKGCFLVLTNFDQSQELKTTAKKSLQFFAFQHVRCRCCYRSYLDRFLNNKSGSHGVPNIYLSNFPCLLIDFGKVLCTLANVLQ